VVVRQKWALTEVKEELPRKDLFTLAIFVAIFSATSSVDGCERVNQSQMFR
jgi:hypothetical protein